MKINEIYCGDSLEVLRTFEDNSIDSIVTDPPYGISFMGKKWDYNVPTVELWIEVMRVLKPGGHCLVACGTRTQHRMAVNLEDAGFEIRDIVAWIYGSGFPKSLNIGKAIDKYFNVYEKGEVLPSSRKSNGNMDFHMKEKTASNPQSDEAKDWEGWGTALKPAMELWTLCRKPCSEKTVAENVLKWGTGGLNIDGCRVGVGREQGQSQGQSQVPDRDKSNLNYYPETLGRFPANLIHDGEEEVLSLFPINKGAFAPVNSGQNGKSKGIYGDFANKGDDGKSFHDGLGSAARFFYCAKASKSERNKGLDGFEEKFMNGLDKMGGEKCGMKTGSGNPRTGVNSNYHPTVKPVNLMRYLIKLITPKNGIVLDPFGGSGTTGIGATIEGFDYILIEREQEYCDIAAARIKACRG